MNQAVYDVADYGANGVAEPAETLELTAARFKWIEYAPGIRATVYRARAGAVYDSVGIQKAIDAAHKAGGGTVVVRPGDYLIGPIELRSHVHLRLEPGARLWASPDISDYEAEPGCALPAYTLANGYNRSSEGLDRAYRRLISAAGARHVGVLGVGQISAQSPAFLIPWLNGGGKDLRTLFRPQDTFMFFRCEGVRLDGITLLNTPAWSMVFDTCRGVRVTGLTLRCFDFINSDGIDLVNSSDVTIADCNLHCTDDAICLKNTVPDATMGRVVVTNCILRTLCNGFKIGTDSVGNFEDVTISNVVMHAPDDIESGDRGGFNLNALDGGTIRNVSISNVVMRNMFCPFYLYATARTGPQTALGLEVRPGRMERVSITNIQADGTRYTCYAVGHPDEPIRDLHVSNVSVRKSRDFYADPPDEPVPHRPNQYPTPFTFGSRATGDQLPASGLYLRDVHHATIRDFSLVSQEHDGRRVFVQEACEEVEVEGLKGRVESAGRPERCLAYADASV